MANYGYKKYMKKTVKKDYAAVNLVKLFAMTFFGMLIAFSLLIKSFSPSVDVSIGDYKYDNDDTPEETQVTIDDRLSQIQDEDNGRTFTDLMRNADDIQREDEVPDKKILSKANVKQQEEPVVKQKQEAPAAQATAPVPAPQAEPVYKVFIGTYSSAEQAKVAKEIIQESGTNLSPIVKCIGSNNYTLQVGIFKNKNSADALLYTIQQNHMPGRIVQDY